MPLSFAKFAVGISWMTFQCTTALPFQIVKDIRGFIPFAFLYTEYEISFTDHLVDIRSHLKIILWATKASFGPELRCKKLT